MRFSLCYETKIVTYIFCLEIYKKMLCSNAKYYVNFLNVIGNKKIKYDFF